MGRSGAGRHEGCEAGQGEARRGQAKRGRSLLSQLHSVCMAFLSQPVINKSLHISPVFFLYKPGCMYRVLNYLLLALQ